MIDTAEVLLWGTRIGIIHIPSGREYLAFEYDRDFLQSGIEIAPIRMPLSQRVYEFPELIGDAFHGAPGLVADSLPDKFGNLVIERWLADQGRTMQDFNVVDRLCYTGTRGMGALEFRPAQGPENNIIEDVNIRKMAEFASEILSKRSSEKITASDNIGYSQLLRLGTSAGGARAKAVIAWNEKTGELKSGQIDAGKGFEYWLVKFDGVSQNGDHGTEDCIEYSKIEYAYYLMARDCGISINECRLLEDGNFRHFMTKRFDRIGNEKLHMQTLAALAHIDYNIPCLCSYEQAVLYMRKIGLTMTEIEQFFKRMVYNVILVNQDDHVKNLSFLMDRNGVWKLSPAYDLTFAYNSQNRWLKAHQMLVNGKNEHLTYEDMIIAGKNMGLSQKRCDSIINEVKAVAANLCNYFEKAGIREETYAMIARVIGEAGSVFAQSSHNGI